MKVNHEEQEFTKLCHARPGDLVQLVSSMLILQPGVLLVTVTDGPACWPSEGLYKAVDVKLFDVATGKPVATPCLSSRAVIYRNAEVKLCRPEKPSYGYR